MAEMRFTASANWPSDATSRSAGVSSFQSDPSIYPKGHSYIREPLRLHPSLSRIVRSCARDATPSHLAFLWRRRSHFERRDLLSTGSSWFIVTREIDYLNIPSHCGHVLLDLVINTLAKLSRHNEPPGWIVDL